VFPSPMKRIFVTGRSDRPLPASAHRKDLAGMQQVGHGIDDRHTRTFSELDAGLVATGPGDDEIVVARENAADIVNRFTRGKTDRFLLETIGCPPSWAMPLRMTTRVRSDSFSKIIATLFLARSGASCRSPLLILRESWKRAAKSAHAIMQRRRDHVS